jgi:integration host factor subunit alpha
MIVRYVVRQNIEMTFKKPDIERAFESNRVLIGLPARELIDGFFDEISAALEAGERVKLENFGVFRLFEKSSRPGRNPKTREEVPISARRVVSFSASDNLRARAQASLEPAGRGHAVKTLSLEQTS